MMEYTEHERISVEEGETIFNLVKGIPQPKHQRYSRLALVMLEVPEASCFPVRILPTPSSFHKIKCPICHHFTLLMYTGDEFLGQCGQH